MKTTLFAAATLTTSVRALLYLFDRTFLEARSSRRTFSVVNGDRQVAGEASTTNIELKFQVLGR